jgi:hypothetical protein
MRDLLGAQFDRDVLAAILTTSVTPGPGFQHAFAAEDVRRAASATSGPGAAIGEIGAKARWLWIASNTSLLVPVFLALGVLYVGATWLVEVATMRTKANEALRAESSAAARELAEARREITSAQREMISEQRRYIADLQRTLIERPGNAPVRRQGTGAVPGQSPSGEDVAR